MQRRPSAPGSPRPRRTCRQQLAGLPPRNDKYFISVCRPKSRGTPKAAALFRGVFFSLSCRLLLVAENRATPHRWHRKSITACVLFPCRNPLAPCRCEGWRCSVLLQDDSNAQTQTLVAGGPPRCLPGRPAQQHRLSQALRLLRPHRGALHFPLLHSRPTTHPSKRGAHQPGVRLMPRFQIF